MTSAQVDAEKARQMDAAWAKHQTDAAGAKHQALLVMFKRPGRRESAYNRHFKRDLLAEQSSVQNHRCCWCGVRTNEPGAPLATLGHVVPKSKGGVTSYHNTVMACFPCSNARGTKKRWIPPCDRERDVP